MGNPNATHAHVVHGPNSNMADASVLKEEPTSLQRMNSLADDTDEKDQNNESNVSMNDSMGESSQNNVTDKNTSSSNMHDMTHQCINEIKETIDDEYDDHDVAYDFDANIDDNEPAIYPSAARMKRFADLTIPAFQLGLISDDESDPEQTERDDNDHEMETDQERTDLTATPIRIRHPSKENDEMGTNTTHEFETENCDENCEEEAGENTPSTPKSMISSSKKRSHEKTVSNEKKEPQSGSANIEQNIHTGDPNIPNISIITQTRNTSTSVITTTTTTIVTRKRSSSDSNHSKSSKDSESSNAKKRKKSDPLGDVHEEDEHELEDKIEDESNKDTKITSNDCDGTSSHKGSETSETSSSLSNKKSSRRSRRIGNKKKE